MYSPIRVSVTKRFIWSKKIPANLVSHDIFQLGVDKLLIKLYNVTRHSSSFLSLDFVVVT